MRKHRESAALRLHLAPWLSRRARLHLSVLLAALCTLAVVAGLSWFSRDREQLQRQLIEARVKRHAALDALRETVLAVDAAAARLSDESERDRLLQPLIEALRNATIDDLTVATDYDEAFRLNLLGRLLQRGEQNREALLAFEAALGRLQHLTVDDEETPRRHQLEVELNWSVGELAMLADEPERAVDCFYAALKRAKAVYEGTPENRQLHRDYAMAVKRVADVLWWELQSYEAVNYYPLAVRQLRMVAGQQPRSADAIVAFLQCLESWASCSLELGEVETASATYEELLHYVLTRRRMFPPGVAWREFEFAAHHGLADAFRARGDAKLARTHCQQALAAAGSRNSPIPSHPQLALDLSAVYGLLVADYVADEEWVTARTMATKRYELLSAYRNRFSRRPDADEHYAHCLASLASLSWRDGERAEAKGYWEQATAALQDLPVAQRSALAHETLFESYMWLAEACRQDGHQDQTAEWLHKASEYVHALAEQRVILDVDWLDKNKKWLQDQLDAAGIMPSP
jgi:tetratricopeptide (TPR) repeat protein